MFLRPDNSLQCVKNNNFMSTLDVTMGYPSVPVHVKDIHKTAYIFPSGCYAFRRMVFGILSNLERFKTLWAMFHSQY